MISLLLVCQTPTSTPNFFFLYPFRVFCRFVEGKKGKEKKGKPSFVFFVFLPDYRNLYSLE